MDITLVPLGEDHRKGVIDVFNHYVEHSVAAYLETPVPYEFYDQFLKLLGTYPAYAVQAEDGQVIGFGLLRPYHPMPTFARTAELSYFLHPDFCKHGLGTRILSQLLQDAERMRLRTILASIAADNEASISFHRKHGFAECGRFRSVLHKNGQERDIVWMQKLL